MFRKQGLRLPSPPPFESFTSTFVPNRIGLMLKRSRQCRAAPMKDTPPKGEITNSANQSTFSSIYRNASLSCPINMNIFQAIFLSWEKCIVGGRWSICSLRIFTFMSPNSISNWRRMTFHACIFSPFERYLVYILSHPIR